MMNGFSFHSGSIKSQNKKSVEIASDFQFMNGTGLCLISFKNGSRMLMSASMIGASIVLFSGVIYYQRIREDFRFKRLVSYGGMSCVFGWLLAITL